MMDDLRGIADLECIRSVNLVPCSVLVTVLNVSANFDNHIASVEKNL